MQNLVTICFLIVLSLLHKNIHKYDLFEKIISLIIIFGTFKGLDEKPKPTTIYICHLFFTFVIILTQFYTNQKSLLYAIVIAILLYIYSKTINKNCFLTRKQLKQDEYVPFYDRNKTLVNFGNIIMFYFSCIILLFKLLNLHITPTMKKISRLFMFITFTLLITEILVFYEKINKKYSIVNQDILLTYSST